MLETEVERRRNNSSSCLSYESKEAPAAQWPAADWLALYSSILITARQKKNLENPPIKWKLEFQLYRKGHASGTERCRNLVQFVLVSIGAHVILKVTLCAAMLTFMWAAISRRWVTINIILRGEGKKDKVTKVTLSHPADFQWCGYCIQVCPCFYV